MTKENTYHALEGIGVKPEAASQNQFNPRLFHRAMNDLQEFILHINASEYTKLPTDRKGEEPEDEEIFNKANNEITPKNKSALDAVTSAVPKGWNITVVVDENENYKGYYGVAATLDCGGSKNVWTKVIIKEHRISEIYIEFPDFASEEEAVHSIEKINIPMRPEKAALMIRSLTKATTAAYTASISTPVKSLDYWMTSLDPNNDRPAARNMPYSVGTKGWANTRGTSVRNIRDNVSEARDDLLETGVEDIHGDPIATTFNTRNPALREAETEEEKTEGGYIRLV